MEIIIIGIIIVLVVVFRIYHKRLISKGMHLSNFVEKAMSEFQSISNQGRQATVNEIQTYKSKYAELPEKIRKLRFAKLMTQRLFDSFGIGEYMVFHAMKVTMEMNRRKIIYVVVGTLLMAAIPQAAARRIRVPARRVVKTEQRSVYADTCENAVTIDTNSTTRCRLEQVTYSGYDKTVEASCESIFVTNTTGHNVKSVTFVIDYLDDRGRQLHQRTMTLSCDIPAGQTRRLDFTSWDKQHTYYYHRSRAPKRRQASPYHITLTPAAYTIDAQCGEEGQ